MKKSHFNEGPGLGEEIDRMTQAISNSKSFEHFCNGAIFPIWSFRVKRPRGHTGTVSDFLHSLVSLVDEGQILSFFGTPHQ